MNQSIKTLRNIIIILLSLTASFLCSCNSPNNQANSLTYSKSAVLFDTYITITIYEDNVKVLNDCISMCEYYDQLFSTSNTESDIYRINHSNCTPVTVSNETILLIDKSIEYSKLTNGKYDITIEPVFNLWDFSNETIPEKSDIDEALTHVSYKNIKINHSNNTVTMLDSNSQITLGSIAKGYIADSVKNYILSCNINSGVIDLGGNILVIGQKPDNTDYIVGIKNPQNPNSATPIAAVKVADKSVVTSGIYERSFTHDNILYHHILDSITGYPVETDISAISIISDSSMEADALSTVCLLLGVDNALTFINSIDETECIIIETDGTQYYSENFNDYLITVQ